MKDTPETDKLFAPMWLLEGPPTDVQLHEANKSHKRLERQRDAYAETLRQVLADCDWHVSVNPDRIVDAIRERHPELGNSPALPPTVGSGEGSTKQAQ